jgi:hypothetical protein
MTVNVLRLAMIGLIVVLVMCVAGIIWLAAQTNPRPIPDVLVGTTTLIVGTIAGILVPRPRPLTGDTPDTPEV